VDRARDARMKLMWKDCIIMNDSQMDSAYVQFRLDVVNIGLDTHVFRLQP
jgi:hypothetical protein